MNKKQVDYLHEQRMIELAYQRDTEIIKLQVAEELKLKAKQIELYGQQQFNQPQQFTQQPQYVGQPVYPQQNTQPETMEEKSKRKYGGVKSG
jgi:hypothetical protein